MKRLAFVKKMSDGKLQVLGIADNEVVESEKRWTWTSYIKEMEKKLGKDSDFIVNIRYVPEQSIYVLMWGKLIIEVPQELTVIGGTYQIKNKDNKVKVKVKGRIV